MAQLIIDGYNVTGTQTGDLQRTRGELISQISAYKNRTSHDITLVFDGNKGGTHGEHIERTGGISIVYTARESADEYIKRTIENSSRQWIVVSSDREIQRAAWSCDCIPIDSHEFIKAISRKPGVCGDEASPDEKSTKGFSQSKRQKAVNRALKKLC